MGRRICLFCYDNCINRLTSGEKMKNQFLKPLLLCLAAVGISACNSGSEDIEVTDPSAYEYKGAPDPLTAVSGADRAGDLADRFDLVQGRQ